MCDACRVHDTRAAFLWIRSTSIELIYAHIYLESLQMTQALALTCSVRFLNLHFNLSGSDENICESTKVVGVGVGLCGKLRHVHIQPRLSGLIANDWAESEEMRRWGSFDNFSCPKLEVPQNS
jgi:hypothetical protein